MATKPTPAAEPSTETNKGRPERESRAGPDDERRMGKIGEVSRTGKAMCRKLARG